MTDQPTYNDVESAALREATGSGWPEWLEALDTAGAHEWAHQEIVDHLEETDVASDWCEAITAGYEEARGRQTVAETARGFQVGVQASVTGSPRNAWDLIVDRSDLWLGSSGVAFEPGERYRGSGASGEVREVEPTDRLLLTWRPDEWEHPATVEITLRESASGTTAIHAHLDELPDADTRQAMRSHWREILEQLVSAPSNPA